MTIFKPFIMKTTLIISFLIFVSSTIYSQVLKYNDLVTIFKFKQLSDVDDYMTLKGYTYIESKNEDIYTTQQWQFINNDNKIWAIMRVLNGEKRTWITYSLSNQQIALSIKNEIKQLGYKLILSKEVNGRIITIYSSLKYKITFLKEPSETQINLMSIKDRSAYEN